MRSDRLVALLAVLGTLVVGLVAPAPAAPASRAPSATSAHPDRDDDDDWKDGRLFLLTRRLPALLPGQEGWVGLTWTATANVCDVKVTASAPGVTVTYPSNTGSYSSLYVRDALAGFNLDFTTFRLAVSPSASRQVDLTVKATYTRIPDDRIKRSDDLKYKSVDCRNGRTGGVTTDEVVLSVGSPSGAKATLETTSASVAAGSPTWVPLTFSTTYAGLTGFRVTLTPPKGLVVTYPGEGTSAGLANGSALPVGGSDAASVNLDASGLAKGTYKVPVKATWSGGSLDSVLNLTVK